MIRLSTIVRGISQGVAQIGLAAVVVQEVIRVEVIAQLQVAEVDVGEVHIGQVGVAEGAVGAFAAQTEVRVDGVADGLVRLDHGVAVAREARTGRDELTDDDVLLEALEVVDLLGEGGFGEHAGGLPGRRPRTARNRWPAKPW